MTMDSSPVCIICGKQVGENGFIGTIKDISVTFCEEHARDCQSSCESCVHSSRCPVSK